jgi:hypothetical protein
VLAYLVVVVLLVAVAGVIAGSISRLRLPPLRGARTDEPRPPDAPEAAGAAQRPGNNARRRSSEAGGQ